MEVAGAPGVRQFPCERCGAKLEFAPGAGVLECPYCGHRVAVRADDGPIAERPFAEGLAALEAEAETEDVRSVACASCAAEIEPPPSAEAFPCPYCGSSIVARATSRRLIRPQALLPFRVPREEATALFRRWIRRLWFAPDALKKMARLEGRLQGLYAPFWTFDAAAVTRYTGERGDAYTMKVGKRSVRRVRWRAAAGTVARDFDDVLVAGSASLPRALAERLEPWELGSLVPYAEEYLPGFLAERYQIDLAGGWERARARMEEVIRRDVRRDIGGDEQRIHTLDTRHDRVTFKHVLLPIWICSYRYRDRAYRFLVNARTGEVQGERPWSWVKITLAALLAAAIAFAIRVLAQ